MIQRQCPVVIREEFLSQWQSFTGIVRLFALRREQRYAVDPVKYHELHETLLKKCRAPSEKEGTENGPFYREIEELLVPWVTLESLAQADDEIVWGLFCRCEQVERVLGGRVARDSDWRRRDLVVLGVAGVAAVLVVVVLAAGGGDPASWPIVLAVRHGFRRASSAIGVSRTVQYLVLGGAIVSLAAAALVWRSARCQ